MKSKINDELNRVKKELYLKAAAVYFDKYGKKLDSLKVKDEYWYDGTQYNFFVSDSVRISDQVESIVVFKEGELNGRTEISGGAAGSL